MRFSPSHRFAPPHRRARYRWLRDSRFLVAGFVLLALSVATGCRAAADGPRQPGAAASEATASEADASGARATSETPAEPLIEAREARPAPGFTRLALSGDSLRLADYRGQVVVLNFWATWCAPCRVETPEFVALQDELKGEGLQFIGVSLDEGGPAAVRAFADEYGVNYPIVMAGRALTRQYGGIPALPTTFVIDKEGRIRKRITGLTSRRRLLPLVRPLLAGQAAQAASDRQRSTNSK